MENKKFKYYVVNFEDGPQMVQGQWLTEDLSVCSWPPWADNLDQRAYDKKMRETPKPDEDWTDCPVLRIRAKGDSFEYVRKKLREAEIYSETDLNTDLEETQLKKRRRTARPVIDSDEEVDAPGHGDDLEWSTKLRLPQLAQPLPGNGIATNNTITTTADVHQPQKPLTSTFQSKRPPIKIEPSQQKSALKNETPSSKSCNSSSIPSRGEAKFSAPKKEGLSRKSYNSSSITLKGLQPMSVLQERQATSEETLLKTVNDAHLDKEQPDKHCLIMPLNGGAGANGKASSTIYEDKATLTAQRMTETEFRAFVIRGILTTNRKLSTLEATVMSRSGISRRGGGHAGEEVKLVDAGLEVLNDLPLLTRADMEKWDKKLAEKEFATKVAEALTQFGGEDPAACTRLIMAHVMSNPCGEAFSFNGSMGKKGAFKDLNFKRVLYRAVRSTRQRFANTTDDVIEKAVKAWLRLSRQRSGGSSLKSTNMKKPSSPASGSPHTPGRVMPDRACKLNSPLPVSPRITPNKRKSKEPEHKSPMKKRLFANDEIEEYFSRDEATGSEGDIEREDDSD